MTSPRPSRFMLTFNFGLVYLFWGSTYLAIDIAVEQIPPPLMCGVRFTIAGLIMLAYCLLRGQTIRYSAREYLHLAVVGLLLLLGGNCTLAFSERHISSGLAALLVASIPLWFMVLDSLLIGHHRVSGRGLAGLTLGFIGTCVLILPQLMNISGVGRTELLWSVALLGGSVSWALGSVLAKKWASGPPTPGGTAWQMVFAGFGNLIFALLRNDFVHVTWTARGVGAVAYLVVAGSLIGYTAFIYILGHAPAAKVSTYAYVNPVVAVFLGWLVLREKVDGYILAGSAIIIAAVVLVTSASVTKKKSEQLELASTVAD
jgi:drug/metabolite transporter (DMT)-like permease